MKTSPGDDAPIVLIVNDEEAIRSVVALVVARLGYRVVTFDDPLKALWAVSKYPVSVVITDALMPRLDGRELCGKIKETGQGASIKVIVMTSLYTSRNYRHEAMNAFRVDEYLSKPVDFVALSEALGRFAPLRTRLDVM